MTGLQHMINAKKELPGRETFSRSPINYSEGMSEDQKDRYFEKILNGCRDYVNMVPARTALVVRQC